MNPRLAAIIPMSFVGLLFIFCAIKFFHDKNIVLRSGREITRSQQPVQFWIIAAVFSLCGLGYLGFAVYLALRG